MDQFKGSLADFEKYLLEEKVILVYFSTPTCSVCQVLKPQMTALVGERFPQIKKLDISLANNSEIGGQLRVFSAPTVIVFVDGRETIRKSRMFSLVEFENELSRLSELLFE